MKENERLEKILLDFLEDYAKKVVTAEEVEALAAVAQVLAYLYGLYR